MYIYYDKDKVVKAITSINLDYQDLDMIDVSEDVINKLQKDGFVTVDNIKLNMRKDTDEDIERIKQNTLRQRRSVLLSAFDKYKSNVEYGIETETEEEHNEIIVWYKKLLDITNGTEDAVDNVPVKIKYYINE